jgi:hypothetical protein
MKYKEGPYTGIRWGRGWGTPWEIVVINQGCLVFAVTTEKTMFDGWRIKFWKGFHEETKDWKYWFSLRWRGGYKIQKDVTCP